MPNELISFRLTPSEIGALGAFKLNGESNSLAGKRLLLDVITGHQRVSSEVSNECHQELAPPVITSHQELVEAVLDDQIKRSDNLCQQMRQSLEEFNSKRAFIDSQIDAAIAPINMRVELLETRVEILVRRSFPLDGEASEFDITTCIDDAEIYQPEKVITALATKTTLETHYEPN